MGQMYPVELDISKTRQKATLLLLTCLYSCRSDREGWSSSHFHLWQTLWFQIPLSLRPKTVRNCCVNERICSVFVSFQLCIVCRLGVFVIRLRQISSLFSLYQIVTILQKSTFYWYMRDFHKTFATGVACRPGRSLFWTPGLVPFETCICSTSWDQSFFSNLSFLLDYALRKMKNSYVALMHFYKKNRYSKCIYFIHKLIKYLHINISLIFGTFNLSPLPPREDQGGRESRMCPLYPQRVVKGDLMGRFLGITV